MSAEVVNLRAVRKARERVKDRGQADANAAKFGRTKAQRAAEEEAAARAARELDAHRREDRREE